MLHVKVLYIGFTVLAFCAATLPYPPEPNTYRAAVLEHAVHLPERIAFSRWEALTQMMSNLRVYSHFTATAKAEHADIVVFPEGGLYGFTLRVRSSIACYLEPIPDPKLVTWNPCNEPRRFARSEVQVYLSCLAKKNSIYVVSNIGDVQSCEWGDPNCPSDGQYQYNTNVVYDRHGKFIARYHKQNLFSEPQFDRPTHPEHVYFDTDFGRFGLITGFDVLFYDPVVPLLEEYNVTGIVLPTVWWDEYPYFAAISFQWSFSVLHGVSVLASNLRLPTWGIFGSGIFSPDGKSIYYHNRLYHGSKLIIGDISKTTKRIIPNLANLNKCKNRKFDFGNYEMRFLLPTEFSRSHFTIGLTM